MDSGERKCLSITEVLCITAIFNLENDTLKSSAHAHREGERENPQKPSLPVAILRKVVYGLVYYVNFSNIALIVLHRGYFV